MEEFNQKMERMVMEMKMMKVVRERAEDTEESRFRALLRLDILCLRTAIVNYSEAELNTKDVDKNSTLRSMARDLWRIGSNVILRSHTNQYSFQLLQLLSQYGSGWVSVNLPERSGQGSLQKSLYVLESHGLILIDWIRDRIKIQGVNLMTEIQENLNCQFDPEMVEDFLRFFDPLLERTMSRSRYIGLTSTLRLVLLSQSVTKLTPGFEASFDQWVSKLSHNPNYKLNDEEKWVMSAGIELYEGLRSLHYKSAEIRFLLRSVSVSRIRWNSVGARVKALGAETRAKYDLDLMISKRREWDSEGAEAKAKDDLDLLMSKAGTYMTSVETIIGSIVINRMPNPDRPRRRPTYLVQYPNHLNSDSLSDVWMDCAKVVESLRNLPLTLTLPTPLTPEMLGLLEQLSKFFMSGWNSWKHLENGNLNDCGDDLGSASFAGILDCLSKEGKGEEILRFVKETKEYLSQLHSYDRCKGFFPEWVLGHALSLRPESGNEKESLLLETEAYVMSMHREQGCGTCLREGMFPHLFKCLAHLERYTSLHGIVTDLVSHIQAKTTTHITRTWIEPYVPLPSALAASVKDMDFVVKEALLEEMLGLAKTFVKMAVNLGVYENVKNLRIDPMGELIKFCYETGMVDKLNGFLDELQVSLLHNNGDNSSVEPMTTTIIYFRERVADGLNPMGQTMTHSNWKDGVMKFLSSRR